MPIIIFGVRRRGKQHGPCVAASCPRCHNEVVLVYVVVTTFFALFFIPIIPLSKKRMLTCPICHWQRDVPKAQEHLALEMIDITQQWKAHQFGDAEYSKRVDAFWSFLTNDAPAAQPGEPSDQSGPAPDAPPPPPTPPAG